MICSTSTLISAIAALSMLVDQVDALPTRRSTSTLSRSAARRTRRSPNGVSFSGRAKRTATGDHSIIVDAATAATNGGGGIKNSTINLTVISRRDNSQSTSIFNRVVRSLFGAQRQSAAPVSTVEPVSVVGVLPVVQHTVKRASHSKVAARAQRRAPRPQPVKTRRVERALSVEDMAEQQSIYQAAVAALPSPTPAGVAADAISAIKMAVASPSVDDDINTASAAVETTPVVESSLVSPAVATSSPAVLEPITLTVTLVAGPDGAYVDQAGLSVAAAAAATAVVSSITLNPKSSNFARASATPVVDASPSPLVAAREPSSAEFAATTAAPTAFAKFRRARRSDLGAASKVAVHQRARRQPRAVVNAVKA